MKTPQEIEKEFKKRFPFIEGILLGSQEITGERSANVYGATPEQVLKFVSQVRSQDRKELLDEIESKIPAEVGHGNYHCGVEECCGKNTKARKHSTEISDAECKGYNECRARILKVLQSLRDNKETKA